MKTYDYYAGMALQALITKAPIIDSKGEIGIKMSEEELQEFKKELCRTAHSYASWMVETRKEFEGWTNKI